MSDFAAQTLPLLRTLPTPLAALLMQQVLRYDTMFPRERGELEATLRSLQPPRSASMQGAVSAFAALHLSPALQPAGWESDPAAWVERLTAEMWSTGQITELRSAARLLLPAPGTDPADAMPRAVVVVYDPRLRADAGPPTLFRRLRPLGTFYPAVDAAGEQALLDTWLQHRAARQAQPYAHWLLSGGPVPAHADAGIATLSYAGLEPARQQLLRRMNDARNAQGGGGPEGLRNALQVLTPKQMGLPADTDPVLGAFATDVLVGGSGTQLYSTTFVQWAAREVLRRAQPRTLVAHFTARNQSTSMDLRLSEPTAEPPLDFAGSLVDTEMNAHLTLVNLQRLPSVDGAHFLAWHPGYGQALLIGQGAAAGAVSQGKAQLQDLLTQMA